MVATWKTRITLDAIALYAPNQVLGTAIKAKIRIRNLLWKQKLRLNGDLVLKKPIFIIGSPRSGTTIAMKLLAGHPDVANLSEVSYIWDPDHFADPEADHDWPESMATKKDATRLHTTFELYRRIHQKKRFLNKHPRNSVRIDYIRKLFPDAYFIHIIRDGRSVVNSLIERIRGNRLRQRVPFGNFCKPPGWRQWLSDDPLEQSAKQWREIVRYVISKRDCLGDNYCQVKYEDMCSRTHEIFTHIFESVGLPNSSDYLASIPDRLNSQNFKYQQQLSKQQIDKITAVESDLLQELGYSI